MSESTFIPVPGRRSENGETLSPPFARWIDAGIEVGRSVWPAFLIASLLIFWGFRWSLPGQDHIGASFHPDENAAVVAVNHIHPPGFNPGVFNWGTTLFYQVWAARPFLRVLHLVPPGNAGVLLAGRFMVWASAMGVICCVFLLGRRLFDAWTGWVATIILAFTPVFIINSHYFKTCVPMTCWLMVSMVIGYRLIDTAAPRYVCLLGFFLGYCISTKYTGVAAVPAGMVFMAMAGPRLHRLRYWLMFFLLIGAGFLLGTPRVLPHPKPFLDTLRWGAEMGRQGLPTHFGRGPALIDYLTRVSQLSMTLPLWIAAVAGFIWFAIAKRSIGLPIWAFLISYSFLLSLDNWRLSRYTVELTPFAAIAVAGLGLEMSRRLPAGRVLAWVALSPVLIYCLLYTVSYVHVMSMEDPRVQAGKWIAANLPRDEPVPISTGHYLGAPQVGMWGYTKLDVNTSVEPLRGAASPWLVLSELAVERYRGALDHFPDTSEFFRYVDANYTEVAHFENSQSFLGVSSKKGQFLTIDWLYPNTGITIYRRRS